METARIKDLQQQVRDAVSGFRETVRALTSHEYTHEIGPRVAVHDNVRIVEADESPFKYALDEDKMQVLVVLRGVWELKHGGVTRILDVSDVVKVPAGSPHPTILKSKEEGAKFVYIQFR